MKNLVLKLKKINLNKVDFKNIVKKAVSLNKIYNGLDDENYRQQMYGFTMHLSTSRDLDAIHDFVDYTISYLNNNKIFQAKSERIHEYLEQFNFLFSDYE
ncbi:MAG: hypothetical protein LBF04_00680 [Prevotellaceae bacterium]|jgi:16S rRNA G527 N7-methylase RsmG|nr:hypothetical protein [Prevotellaceae bacterium]